MMNAAPPRLASATATPSRAEPPGTGIWTTAAVRGPEPGRTLAGHGLLERALKFARAGRAQALAGLQQFVRWPSVSSEPARKKEVLGCADWLAGQLREAGLERVAVVKTAGHPLVTAGWQHAPGRPTLLIYGHYDVQPAGPEQEWRRPPFDPQVRDGYLYGRGASDDKGQLWAHVCALRSYLQSTGRLPVNVVCLFEGEEEIGSPHLRPYLAAHAGALAADAAVISDTAMLAPGRPALVYSQRGKLGLELDVAVPRPARHSGNYGGALVNPLSVLARILAGLHDRQGRVAVPGFYAGVRDPDPAERAFMRRYGVSDAALLAAAGCAGAYDRSADAASPAPNPCALREPGYSLYEQISIRPALMVLGLAGGFTGQGSQSTLPNRAAARLECRLVMGQNPAAVHRALQEHLAAVMPRGVQWRLQPLGNASRATFIDRSHPALAAAALACRRGLGAAPVWLRSGGTIPTVNWLQETLRVPVALMGFGLPDDAIHGANERFSLTNFYAAIETSLWFLTALSRIAKERLA